MSSAFNPYNIDSLTTDSSTICVDGVVVKSVWNAVTKSWMMDYPSSHVLNFNSIWMSKLTARQMLFLSHNFYSVLNGHSNHSQYHKGLIRQKSTEWQRHFKTNYKVVMGRFFRQENAVYVPGAFTAGYSFDKESLQDHFDYLQTLIANLSDKKLARSLVTLPDETTTTHPVCNVVSSKEDIYLHNLSRILKFQKENYHYSCGRRFTSGPSLQNAPKKYRSVLLSGKNVCDVDMVNAHPTLLKALLTEKGYDVTGSALADYVDNRDSIIAAHPDFNMKNAVRMTVYGAGDKTIKKECGSNIPAFIVKLKEEVKVFSQLLVADCKEAGKLSHKVSFVLNTAEDKHLQAMEEWCKSNGKNISALMFDGMMVDTLTETEVKEMTDFANGKTGYGINLLIKENF